MLTFPTFKQHLAVILSLGLPVFFAQLAQTSMGFVDTVVAGRAGAVDMAGVAIANSFWFPFTLFGCSLLTVITPLVAQNVGAGNYQGLGRYLRQAAWLSFFLSLCLMVFFFCIALILPQIKSIEPELSAVASRYLLCIVFGVPGLLLCNVFRGFLEGKSLTRPSMIAGFIGLICNIPLNIIFVFGLFGFPAMGGAGCGLASAFVCWIMASVMLFFVYRNSRQVLRYEKPDKTLIKRIARIGFPSACALLVETSSFAVIALLLAPLGTTVVASHQIALNISGMFFMIPLAIGIATNIRVGTFLGAGRLEDAQNARRSALIFGMTLCLATIALLLLFRSSFAKFYTADPAVIALAGTLIIYMAIYQFPDTMQMIMGATLRGYNDTKVLFILTFIAYWCISLPVGYTLCFTSFLTPAPLNAAGFWIGIIAGLTVLALLVALRVFHLERYTPEKVAKKIHR